MAPAPLQTQVAVLKEQTNTLHNDLSEIWFVFISGTSINYSWE